RPMVGFALAAMITGLVGSAALIAALFEAFNGSDQPTGVLFGLGVLYAALAITLLFWGMLAEIIYRTGDLRREVLASLAANNQEAEAKSLGT
ncbi:MAG: hypothetical protein WA970_22040, partial [Gammaproteobacteria bacterium]